jgi:hypothetical protein
MKHPWLNYKMFKCTHDCGYITTIKHPHGNHYCTWIEGSRAIQFDNKDGEYIVTKWGITEVTALRMIDIKEENEGTSEDEEEPKPIPKVKTLEVRKGNDVVVDIMKKRDTIKEFTELLDKSTPIKEIKEMLDFDSIKEEAKWKIYSKELELKKMNRPLQALELMKSIDPYINNEIRWFFLVTKCLMITNQWKEIEAWKYRYMFLPENQLQANKFYL